ncbi:F-box protein At3g54460 [Oryza brachyantha]|uniref:F-box domain-containing protein n=1 Tax=Oryza brachyantha TaxID=4533 RepID=J3L7W7_ORYBR|nr:F-box protein At3g54460 [Oryza brachyantha]
MDEDEVAAAAAARRKLGGYLRAVVSVPCDGGEGSLAPLSPCSLFSCGEVSLAPVHDGGATTTPTPRSKWRACGGGGGGSVVRQLRALVSQRCVEVEGRVLRVVTRRRGGDGEVEARAVVLFDVYLPVSVWSGWQFPRSRAAAAAAIFKHVSCNWDARNDLLAFNWTSPDNPHCDDQYIWTCTDCHVLGCEVHQMPSVLNNEKSFDLHEIFKTLPSVRVERRMQITRITPDEDALGLGIWSVPDDILYKVLVRLKPRDLIRVAAACHHLRTLSASIMPCMKLKLFPHQEAAVEWMLKREQNLQALAHPLYKGFCTMDGFPFYVNVTSGEISTGNAPTVHDFCGGMFCDEPGLGKTVTALSLILKTHGTLAVPPPGMNVMWCMHKPDKKYGYYELSASNSCKKNIFLSGSKMLGKDVIREDPCSSESSHNGDSVRSTRSSRKRGRLVNPDITTVLSHPSGKSPMSSPTVAHPIPATHVLKITKNLKHVRKNLMDTYNDGSVGNKRKRDATSELSETWVQCDACRKWRRLLDGTVLDSNTAWFCSMNPDSAHQKCSNPEESWDLKRKITYLPGFYRKGAPPGNEQNASFFANILKENADLIDSETMKALLWLAKLSPKKHLEMEAVGLTRPVLDARANTGKGARPYYKIFQAFGLLRKVEKGITRWYYPSMLDDLAFDSAALGFALEKPLDLVRLYLSRATLIVVPANLIDHWTMQIQRHVSSDTLNVYVWGDHKKPSAHNLAWDYDIVITTFSRLSAEWGPKKRSVLKQIHWFRVILDEGHTLGSSLALTNKLQMAVSLVASNRWILTGTPTPNTPTSQVSHLHPMLKFLHEEVYGQNYQLWDTGIHRPFEAQMEEGRSRLLQLLQRTMISARKSDLKNIPPCIKKITFLGFSEGHAKSYNELAVTIRRNILMADWNDPSHVESLLNPKQWKFRTTTIKNVRLSCCVAGHIKVAEAGQDIQETMDALMQQGLDPSSEEYQSIRYALLNGASCFRCRDWCRLPVITPCRHLLCLDCVALDSEKCTLPGCGKHYEMQTPETLARPENPNPKWPVPKDLIELQPSYKQDDWDPDWQSTTSSKVAYLVEKLRGLRAENIKHGCSSNRNNGACLSSQSSCQDHNKGRLPHPMPDKVIIFSQFLEHIHVIEQQLTISGITYAGMYSPMPLGSKRSSLMKFKDDPACMALVMDGTAALGLDLSFVSYVFLMEPIWDRSMEEQVISRAHRMGATRPIFVETLAMRGTIEEQMLKLLQDSNACRQMVNKGTSGTDNEGARPHRSLHDFAESSYLAQLSFVKGSDAAGNIVANTSKILS